MAKEPKNPVEDARKKLETEAIDRLRECRRWKEIWSLDFKECYFFASPHRQRQISSQTQPSTQRLLDAAELNTEVAFELSQDFVTEIVNTYMPEAQNWCERRAGMFIPDGAWEKVSEQVKGDDKKIFEAMKASNLYPETQKAFFPDISIGTAGMWIERPTGHGPIAVKAIPLRELEINLGPDGEIDDRFAIRYTRNRYVRSLLPGVELPKNISDTITKNPNDRTEVRWGFWRKWDDIGDEVWQHVVMVGDKLVKDTELRGEGSCMLLVMRFNPSADWPWGLGPLIQGLPTLRQIDELERQRMEHGELSLSPPITFPDDSFAQIEQGLEPSMAYPIRPGSEGAVKAIYTPPPPDAANYQYDEKLQRLKKLFYVDFPEQSGDTPPTLGQWLDELARAQRRIGAPGMPFWREGPCKIFLRYKFLLEAAGVIQPIQVDGKMISVQPYNPTQRAAEQQEIATATQYLALAAQTFPEEFRLVIDGKQTLDAFATKMRVTGLIKFRDENAVKAILPQIAQLIQGRERAGGAPTQAPQAI